MRWLLGALLLLSLPSTAVAKNPWEELMGPGKPQLWNDPAGRFYLDLPIGWNAYPQGDAPVVLFEKRHPDYGYVARATVQMRGVPPGVKLSHFAVRIGDEMQQSTHQYRALSRERRTISGQPAIIHHFTHQERGHTALLNEVEQAIFIVKERAFVVTFEMAAGSRPAFQEDIDKMLAGFVGRGPGDDGAATPKPRKKIKEGEMINPDAIRY